MPRSIQPGQGRRTTLFPRPPRIPFGCTGSNRGATSDTNTLPVWLVTLLRHLPGQGTAEGVPDPWALAQGPVRLDVLWLERLSVLANPETIDCDGPFDQGSR